MTTELTPYTPPHAVERTFAPGSGVGFLIAAGVVFFLVGIGTGMALGALAAYPFGVSGVLFFVAFLRSARHQWRLFAAPAGLVSAWAVVGNFAVVLLSLGASALGALTAFVSTLSFSRGRQVEKHGRKVFAELFEAVEHRSEARVGVPEEVAEAWRKNGLTEHASVAAFARLSIELLELGAPPRLVDAAHADALDESRHTDLCFELARELDGRDVRPGAFPTGAARATRGPRTIRLCRLAVESLIDGAINEGVSARVVAELSKAVTDPKIAEVLRAIARDEGRHAVHGFEVLAWCIQEGGRPVVAAVESALAHLPATLGRGLSEDAADGRWERYGIPSRGRETEAFEVVRARTIQRTRRLIEKARAA